MSGTLPDSDPNGTDVDPVQCVRMGHGANCSSLGSVIDTLFATAAVGAAVFAAVTAALRAEDIRITGPRARAAPMPAAPSDESPARTEPVLAQTAASTEAPSDTERREGVGTPSGRRTPP